MTTIDFCVKNFGQARLLTKLLSLPINRLLGQRLKLTNSQFELIQSQIALLDSGYPLDYLLGSVNFCNQEFVISKDVLIPRPATEFWVNELIQQLETLEAEAGSHTTEPLTTLVEVGTGSGIIGLTLAPLFTHNILTDISRKALEVAKNNQIRLCPTHAHIEFIQNDLLDNVILPTANTNWILVANLPYIPIGDLINKEKNRVSAEPEIALYSGIDGLDLTRKLIHQLVSNYSANMPSQIWLELDPRNIYEAKKIIQTAFQTLILKPGAKWIYNILTDEDDFARVLVIKQFTN